MKYNMENKPQRFYRIRRFIDRTSHKLLIVRSAVALLFFFLAYAVFYPISQNGGDLRKIFVVTYGFIFIAIAGIVIGQFFSRTYDLINSGVKKTFSFIFSINLISGLVIPLLLTNIVLLNNINLMSWMRDMGTFACELRKAFIGFYYSFGTFAKIDNLVNILVLAAIVIFFLGVYIDRHYNK